MKDLLTVLAVGAHPDDLEILCAATLARYAAGGHKVIMAHLTNGDKGHTNMDPAKLATLRRAEAQAAGRIIGAEVVGLDLPDARLFSDDKTRDRVIDLVRQARPDVVITLSRRDYSSDHVTTSRLVCDATFLASAPLIKTDFPHIDKLPPIYFCDTVFGLNSDADIYVDVSETFAAKLRMLRCHKSQLKWLKDHTKSDVVKDVECVGRFRGIQCGVRYAEAFSEYNVWPFKVPQRLLP